MSAYPPSLYCPLVFSTQRVLSHFQNTAHSHVARIELSIHSSLLAQTVHGSSQDLQECQHIHRRYIAHSCFLHNVSSLTFRTPLTLMLHGLNYLFTHLYSYGIGNSLWEGNDTYVCV